MRVAEIRWEREVKEFIQPFFPVYPPIPRAASTSDPKPFDAIAVPPLWYEAANDAMSKIPPVMVSPGEETVSCDTSEPVDAIAGVIALVLAMEVNSDSF